MFIQTSAGAFFLALSIFAIADAQARPRHLHHRHMHERVQDYPSEPDHPDTRQRTDAYINSEGEYIPSLLEPSVPSDQ